jgi:hypothetical protein
MLSASFRCSYAGSLASSSLPRGARGALRSLELVPKTHPQGVASTRRDAVGVLRCLRVAVARVSEALLEIVEFAQQRGVLAKALLRGMGWRPHCQSR